MVHIGAIERLGKRVMRDRNLSIYRPNNLLSVLHHILDTYKEQPGPPCFGPNILVVDWSGKILRPSEPDERARVVSAIVEAQKRLALLGAAMEELPYSKSGESPGIA
jgi:hypothetical protein